MTVADPTLEYETGLHAEGARYVIGCDEVGRGALAGPVAVGICVVDAEIGAHPAGLRDSKMLSEKRREEMAPLATGWARHSAVGLATAAEIDEFGIMIALGMAGQRALAQVVGFEEMLYDSILLLDGSYNWLTPVFGPTLAVRTRVKADRDCASVAAASVVAKVHRDRMMIDYDPQYPGYGWVGNKGYASAEHMAAIQSLGPSALHRLTWLHDHTQPELEIPVN